VRAQVSIGDHERMVGFDGIMFVTTVVCVGLHQGMLLSEDVSMACSFHNRE